MPNAKVNEFDYDLSVMNIIIIIISVFPFREYKNNMKLSKNSIQELFT